MKPRILLLVVALIALAACGSPEPTDTGAGGGGGGDLTLTIESPMEGEEVSVPFTIELASSVEIGPGAHHVHIYFDGNEDDYTVVEATSYEVTDLPSGQHEIHASLRNSDHSETGVDTSVAVAVSGGAGGGEEEEEEEEEDTGGSGGYDY